MEKLNFNQNVEEDNSEIDILVTIISEDVKDVESTIVAEIEPTDAAKGKTKVARKRKATSLKAPPKPSKRMRNRSNQSKFKIGKRETPSALKYICSKCNATEMK